MLCEMRTQFDVLTHDCSWAGYDVLILPDYVACDDDTAQRLRDHLAAGGRIIASGWSGLDPDNTHFVLPEWCADYTGDETLNPTYFRPSPAISADMPDMPIDFYGPGVRLASRGDAIELAEIVAPYYNREFDGEHYSRYAPPDKPAGRPAVVRNDQITHISHAVFTSYLDTAWWALRNLVSNLLEHALPMPLVKAPGLPSFARVTVTQQPGRRMVHLLAYVPERRGKAVEMIEEPSRLGDVELALRCDGAPPARVYLAPGGQDLPWEVADGYVQTRVPDVVGYAMVVVEDAS